MSYCVAFGCANRPADRAIGITFHRFPADTTLRQKWLTAMTRGDWTPDPCGRVCSVHFKQSDMIRSSPLLTKLRRDAVPCFFPQTFKHAIRNSDTVLADNTEMEVVEMESDDESLNVTSNPTTTTTSATTTTTTTTTTTADLAEKIIQDNYDVSGKTLFTIINEMANEMNAIKRKVNAHLVSKRKKNCRLKSQIEKLKKSLIEIKEQNSQNYVLASLFEHALKDPELTPLAEDSNPNINEIAEKTIESLPVESTEKSTKQINQDSFASYLSTEMKKFSPEDLVALKSDIKNCLIRNKPGPSL